MKIKLPRNDFVATVLCKDQHSLITFLKQDVLTKSSMK